jgi:hypothetical protein
MASDSAEWLSSLASYGFSRIVGMEPWRELKVESPICILHFTLILMNDDTEGREVFSNHHLRLWQ